MKKSILIILSVFTLIVCSSFNGAKEDSKLPDNWESFTTSNGETIWYGDFVYFKTKQHTPVYLHYGDNEPAFYANEITYSFGSKINNFYVASFNLPENYEPCQFYIDEDELNEL